jgi:asparagine synthase (glutamine-hydrolysing)
MTASLARRGPDAHGIESWTGAVLGHRRLAIFDLSDAGRQPMLSPDGAIGVVFNGAIYNFLELRAELESKGYRFRTRTDTEVLIHGYAAWGIDHLVSRLRGMFAFAVWDARRRKLTLVRDRLGVKPLAYVFHAGTLAFASTLRALRDGGFAGEVDADAVLEFLEFGWITDARSIYSGAHKVPPATIVEWQEGQISQRCYWSPPAARQSGSIRFEEAVEQAEAAILESVRLRLFADVPVGALLSAGIDSALVCWAMAKLNANVRSFTIGTPGDIGDETAGARRTAHILGIPHEIIHLPPSARPALSDLISAYGEPFASASALGMLRVSKPVKDKVTVLLTGDGGDDVFLGYPRHLHLWYAQRLANALPPGSDTLWNAARPLIARISALRRPMHLLDYSTRGIGAAAPVHNGMEYLRQQQILGPLLSARKLPGLPQSLASARQVLSEFLQYERKTRFTGEYLTKVDGATMFYGVEARSPFLDQVVWEFASALPYDVRLHGGELKAILRAIVRNRLGPEVADREKRGFNIPVAKWLAAGWQTSLSELRSGTLLEQEGWIRPGALATLVDQAVANGQAPDQLWRLLILEHWFHQERHRSPATKALAGSKA